MLEDYVMGHFGHDHEHEHCHCHDHNHDHEHCHCHDHNGHHHHEHAPVGDGSVSAQTIAVLKYMLEHNIHHASELNDLAQQLTGEARHQMEHAVEAFDQANGYLSAALEHLK